LHANSSKRCSTRARASKESRGAPTTPHSPLMLSPDSIQIRQVRLEDIEAFHTYSEFIAHERRYWGKTEPKTLPELLEWFNKVRKQGAPFLVAFDGEELVGHADLTIPTK